MAAFVNSWITCVCLAILFACPALAQSPSVPSQSPPAVRPAAPIAPPGLAAALRASTRNDSVSFLPPVPLVEQFLNGVHTGPVERAVVGVEVINRAKGGAIETRRCSGLLLRCDGFFLLPPGVTPLSMSGGEAVKQTVRATLHPGSPDEQQAEARIRHYIVAGIDMCVMKLQGVHAPAARPLMPNSLKPGDEVEIVWTDWDANAMRFGAVQHRTAKIAEQPASEAARKTLAWHEGEIQLTEPQKGIPGGAAVMAGGMAFGVMPGSAARHDRFVSFARLEQITNCVIAAPTTDAEFALLQAKDKDGDEPPAAGENGAAAAGDPPQPKEEGAAGKPKHVVNDMVDIPGGPVRLPARFQEDQRDMCGEVIACVPPFKIDRYKVSNREYYDFWKSIPAKDRSRKEVRAALYPLAWADSDPPFPAEIDDLPVLGVPVTGARAYAYSKGKRLPTSYEWSRAAFGLFGDAAPPAWVSEYLRDRQLAWTRIAVAHDQYVRTLIPGLVQQQRTVDFDKVTGRPRFQDVIHSRGTIPFLMPEEEYGAAGLWSQKKIHEEVVQLVDRWFAPLYILPSGSRPFDTSPFGVRDVILNGNERIIFSPEPDIDFDGLWGGRPTTVEIEWNMPAEMATASWMTPMRLQIAEVPHPVFAGAFPSASPLLLSRRLVASSGLVNPDRREFTPSDAEAYTEYRTRIYEELTMALPVVQMRVTGIRGDTVYNDDWGEGTTPTARDKRIAVWRWPSAVVAPQELTAKRLRGHALPLESDLRYRQSLSTADGTGVRLDEAIILFEGIYFNETPFYSAWQGISPFMRREMGRDWAKDPPMHVGAWPIRGESLTQPPDIYLIPNGFRCAR